MLVKNLNVFFKIQTCCISLLGAPFALSAGLLTLGASYLEDGISWQHVVIENEKIYCQTTFPGKPKFVSTDKGYTFRSEDKGCIYELHIPLEADPSSIFTAQALAYELSYQWKEPEFDIKILQQAMVGVSYVLELRSVNEGRARMVGRFYGSENGLIYSLWVYGSGIPHYEIFDNFSLKKDVTCLN